MTIEIVSAPGCPRAPNLGIGRRVALHASEHGAKCKRGSKRCCNLRDDGRELLQLLLKCYLLMLLLLLRMANLGSDSV